MQWNQSVGNVVETAKPMDQSSWRVLDDLKPMDQVGWKANQKGVAEVEFIEHETDHERL